MARVPETVIALSVPIPKDVPLVVHRAIEQGKLDPTLPQTHEMFYVSRELARVRGLLNEVSSGIRRDEWGKAGDLPALRHEERVHDTRLQRLRHDADIFTPGEAVMSWISRKIIGIK